MLAVKKLLHPTDFSKQSDPAFELACALARDYDAKLLLLHVTKSPVVIASEGVVPVMPEEHVKATRLKLDRMVAKHPDVKIEPLLFAGDPIGEVVRVARRSKVDAIIMGTHGRSGLKRILLGSVAEGVLRDATCPVVTVKLPFRMPAAKSAARPAAKNGKK